jgi:hypothetical protein
VGWGIDCNCGPVWALGWGTQTATYAYAPSSVIPECGQAGILVDASDNEGDECDGYTHIRCIFVATHDYRQPCH